MAKTTSSLSSSTSPSTSAAMPTALPLEFIHDAAQQVNSLRWVLQDDKQRIACFLGAGCPLGIYNAAGEASITLIPAVVKLTEKVAEGLDALSKTQGSTTKLKSQWDALCEECKQGDGQAPTVEDVLTELRTLANRRGKKPIDGMTKDDLRTLDQQICSQITGLMNKPLPNYRCSYHRFASWIAGVYRSTPVEVFTPNFDLLFEEAFEQQRLPHFDGFVGSKEPWFDLASIEQDSLPARWTKLWKLHGSVNWQQTEESIDGIPVPRVVRVTGGVVTEKVMIFPSHLKYEQSRRMPYLAMLDRFKTFFHGNTRVDRTVGSRQEEDAPRLIVCGYSFLDDHLNEILLDGLRGNRNAQCFALMHSNLAKHPRVVSYAQKQGNLTVLARDGAVIGTRIGKYRLGSIGSGENKPWLDEEVISTSGSPVNEPRCLLGDFHYFGLFLEQLCGGRSEHGNFSN